MLHNIRDTDPTPRRDLHLKSPPPQSILPPQNLPSSSGKLSPPPRISHLNLQNIHSTSSKNPSSHSPRPGRSTCPAVRQTQHILAISLFVDFSEEREKGGRNEAVALGSDEATRQPRLCPSPPLRFGWANWETRLVWKVVRLMMTRLGEWDEED